MYHGDRFVMYKNTESPWGIPKASRLFYVDYTSVKNCKAFENKHMLNSHVHTFESSVQGVCWKLSFAHLG